MKGSYNYYMWFQIHPDSHARNLKMNFPRGLQFLSSVLIYKKNKIAVAITNKTTTTKNNKKMPLGKCNGLLYPM